MQLGFAAPLFSTPPVRWNWLRLTEKTFCKSVPWTVQQKLFSESKIFRLNQIPFKFVISMEKKKKSPWVAYGIKQSLAQVDKTKFSKARGKEGERGETLLRACSQLGN